VLLTGLVLFTAPAGAAEAPTGQAAAKKCEGPFKGGKRPTPEELARVLRAHAEWLRAGAGEDDPRRANLCGANLNEANLRGVNLREADLTDANLTGRDLRGADFKAVYLNGALLSGADLTGANLVEARLERAALGGANLTGANLNAAFLEHAYLNRALLVGARLFDADLRSANLGQANLAGADLRKADLRGADFAGADLRETIFEPSPGGLPLIHTIALASNLSRMTFQATPLSLVELREEFKRRGLRRQEREIIFAIRHTERRKEWEGPWPEKIESGLHYVFFEATCLYGLSPGRPLAILAFLIPLFAVPYAVALHGRRGRSGIWAVRMLDRVHKRNMPDRSVRVTGRMRLLGSHAAWLRNARIALYFSLLSAFNLGWRELNIGDWIARLQAREYTLRATGWVRAVSGLQSLISVYLVALWVLSYFGRPFE
jgi:uncharacterized protein YjbI with pentapeptide repeats